MGDQDDPIMQAGRGYARFYPPLLVAFLVLTAFPLYEVKTSDYGNIYHLAGNGDGLSVLGIILLFCYLGVLAGSAVAPGHKGAPIAAAILGAILVLMLAFGGRGAYSTPPPLTGAAGMAIFLGILGTVLAILHAAHIGVLERHAERAFRYKLAQRRAKSADHR